MSTRSSVAIINKDNSITASYIHHDGYISGVGGQLLEHYNNGPAASRVARMGYASSLYDTVKESRANSGKRQPAISSIKEFIEDVKRSDLEFVYVWMKDHKCNRKDEVSSWYVFARGAYNAEISWVGLDGLAQRNGKRLIFEFATDALRTVERIRNRDGHLFLQDEYLSHANELEHMAFSQIRQSSSWERDYFMASGLVAKAENYFEDNKVQILIRDLEQIKESYEGSALRGSAGPCDVKGTDGYMHQGIYMGSFFHPGTNQYYDQDDDGSWFRYETDREGYLDLHSRQPIEIGRI